MSPGKMASQASHAALDAWIAAEEQRPDTIPLYKIAHGIKVCLVARTLHQLLKAHNAALDAGIPSALITDLGYTCFDGQPTITALGVGPARREEVLFLRKYQLCH